MEQIKQSVSPNLNSKKYLLMKEIGGTNEENVMPRVIAKCKIYTSAALIMKSAF